MILLQSRDRKDCLDSRTRRSADCGSDHPLVWAKISGKVWRQERTHKPVKRRRKLEVLRDPAIAEAYEFKIREKMEASRDPSYTNLVEALKSATDELCPVIEKGHRPWLEGDPECLDLLQNRREAKMNDFQGVEYRRLCKEVTKACRRAKRRRLGELCSEAENAAKKGDTREVYEVIKKVSKKKNVNPGLGVKNEDGKLIFDKEGIKERWF